MKLNYFETLNKLKVTLNISNEKLADLLEISLETLKQFEDLNYKPNKRLINKIEAFCKENKVDLVEFVPDYEFINKICNLAFSTNDVSINQCSVRYDYDHPFEKYYNLEIITKAYNKLIDRSWSIKKFTYWIVIYYYIINGGFYDDVIEDFTTLESVVIENLTYLLDGFSFIYSYKEKQEWESLYINIKNLDHILKTISSWRYVYTFTNEKDLEDSNFYSIFINDNLKECLISLYDDSFLDTIDNNLIKKINKKTFIDLINTLIKNGYEFLTYDEECLLDEDEFKDLNLTYKIKNY